MIVIVAKRILKQGVKEAYMETVKPLIDASRKEEGCISYDLFEDTKNPNVLAFIERWKDQAAIDFHGKTEHFTTIVPQLAKFSDEPSDVTLYEFIL